MFRPWPGCRSRRRGSHASVQAFTDGFQLAILVAASFGRRCITGRRLAAARQPGLPARAVPAFETEAERRIVETQSPRHRRGQRCRQGHRQRLQRGWNRWLPLAASETPLIRRRWHCNRPTDLVVVAAGAHARGWLPIEEQTWESFSAPWNVDGQDHEGGRLAALALAVGLGNRRGDRVERRLTRRLAAVGRPRRRGVDGAPGHASARRRRSASSICSPPSAPLQFLEGTWTGRLRPRPRQAEWPRSMAACWRASTPRVAQPDYRGEEHRDALARA